MATKTKRRLDVILVERGLAETRSKAQALIMAGHVLVDNVPSTKAGTPVNDDAAIEIKEINPYVSRGGLKLEGALKGFGISVEGKVCMDVGASTGGFTDCMLQRGARIVYAIDVGHRQLHPKLLSDPRVVSLEGVNFRYFSIETLKHEIEFATIDVSFISLEKVLPAVARVLVPRGEVLALVKPQFEVPPSEAKKGVVRDENIRRGAIEKIRKAAASGFTVKGGMDSAVKGPRGNREHFLWLEKIF